MNLSLLEFLRSLKADPTDAQSPSLFAVEREPSDTETAFLLGAYERRPYALVLGLPGNRNRDLHDGSGFYTALIDIVLIQPAPAGSTAYAARAAIDALMDAIKAGAHAVTTVPYRVLTHPLTLVTEVTPQPRDSDPRALTATLRYRARYHTR